LYVGSGSRQAESIGYVPRNRTPALTASGLTFSNGKKTDDQTLDAASEATLAKLHAKDADIDRGIDDISGVIDRLGNIATDIRDKVCNFILPVSYDWHCLCLIIFSLLD